jgi:hypothetical protein
MILDANCEAHVTSWGHLLAPEGIDVAPFVAAGGDDRNAAYKQRRLDQEKNRKALEEDRAQRDLDRQKRREEQRKADKAASEQKRKEMIEALAKQKAECDPIEIVRLDNKAVTMKDATAFLSAWRDEFDVPAKLINMDAVAAKFDVPKEFAAKFFQPMRFGDFVVFAVNVTEAPEPVVEEGDGSGQQPIGQSVDVNAGAPEDV